MRFAKKEEPNKAILFSKFAPKKFFSGKTPDLLVGSYGYPNVNVGALSAEEYNKNDNPQAFAKNNIHIKEILTKRQSMINSRTNIHIKKKQNSFIEQTQEIAKSSKAVETEVELEKPLPSGLQFHERSLPHGPSAQLKKLTITENPHIKRPIQQLTEDMDVKANTALLELQNKHIDEYQLTKLLSAGTLGIDRKLVPTKWSITAVDDILAKSLHNNILDNAYTDYALYAGEYLGNKFIILIIPGAWSFELMELVEPNSIYNQSDEYLIAHDFEYTQGRKKYAQNTSGGYYATRLPILEWFGQIHKQGQAIVFRVITKEYTVPLGVWVVREGVRLSLKHKQTAPSGKKELLEQAKIALKQLGIPTPDSIIQHSKIIKEQQDSLKKWF